MPGVSMYFHQDDFIHMTYSDSFIKLLESFNIFQKGDFPFYRPIPTQVYFFTMRSLFGLNPLGYHLTNFLLFSINIILVYKLAKIFTSSPTAGLLASTFFGINATHIAPLYAPAYCHELFYVMFGTLCIYMYVKDKRLFSLIFYILALMSKETAVVLPGIIAITYMFRDRKKNFSGLIKTVIPYICILGIYLLGHIIFYGLAKGPSYIVILGKPTLNILTWYILWALSVPNILIDFVGPGLKINPTFFQVAGNHANIFFISFVGFIVASIVVGVGCYASLTRMESIRRFLFAICWFVIGLIPLIIFPLHKLGTEQAFSLVGLAIFLGWIYTQVMKKSLMNRFIALIGISLYLIHAVNTISMAPKTHWIALSAKQAKLTTDYLKKTYPMLSSGSILYFKNGVIKIPEYGSAKQIYQATGNGAAIGIIYNDQKIQSYFDDAKPLPITLQKSPQLITLDASKFLGY
jgi:hypothetical protein